MKGSLLMDLIYISDFKCEEKKYVPNFTIPDVEDVANSSKKTKTTSNANIHTAGAAISSATGLGISALSFLAPISLLIGASVAIPAIYKLVVSHDNTETVPEESYHELQTFISKHSLDKQQALDLGLKFPPGHPQTGETYRLHPLAAYQHASKQKLYIPEHIFDDVLFEERESELLTLLVHLGATNVEIAKYVDSFFDDEKSGSIGGGVKVVANASILAKSESGRESSEKNIRVFSLKGKPWKYGDKFDRDGYAWLNFEPSWNALITAREVGGCTNATLEIKEASKYAVNKEASMQLKSKIYSANGTLKFMEKYLQETSYIVKVSFLEVLTT